MLLAYTFGQRAHGFLKTLVNSIPPNYNNNNNNNTQIHPSADPDVGSFDNNNNNNNNNTDLDFVGPFSDLIWRIYKRMSYCSYCSS